MMISFLLTCCGTGCLPIASQLLKDLDDNKLPLFSNLPAPAIAKSYWKLGDEAMFRDLVLAVRCEVIAEKNNNNIRG